jgi:hypothetical protein
VHFLAVNAWLCWEWRRCGSVMLSYGDSKIEWMLVCNVSDSPSNMAAAICG